MLFTEMVKARLRRLLQDEEATSKLRFGDRCNPFGEVHLREQAPALPGARGTGNAGCP